MIALLLASGSASIASEPTPVGGEEARLGSEAFLAGWLAVFLALAGLYSFDRRQRTKGGVLALQGAAPGLFARVESPHVDAAPERPIDRLLRKKPFAAPPETPRPPPAPPPKLALPEEPTLLRRPPRRGAKESGEESFSVADADVVVPVAPPGPCVPSPVAPAASAATPGCLERCVALRVERHFAEAARVARAGLAGDDEPGPLLIELSRAELGLGHVNAAIDTARDAHFVARSRETLSHLIRLLIETRRFTREDGPNLRRAVTKRPDHALLRHAAGVFESMYGEPREAEEELRAALRLEPDTELRREIERDLARVAAHSAPGSSAG